MSKKLTKEEFVARAREVHGDKYDYSKVEYVNSGTKVIIICPIHGEFKLTPGNHIHGLGCRLCRINAAKTTLNLFIDRANLVHHNKYDYSQVEYINTDTKVCIICPKHGKFEQRPNDHLKGKGCPKCGKEHMAGKIAKTTQVFIEEANVVHNYKYDYSKVHYTNNKTTVCIICPEHGEFWLKPDNHINQKSGCPICAIKQRAESRTWSTEKFIQEANKIHGNKYDYSKTVYIKQTEPVIITCPEHGDFIQKPHEHITGCGCQKCKLKSQTVLFNKLKLVINTEILFEATCASINWLPNYERIDIYFPKYNIAVEYDGQQHFQAVESWGGDAQLKIQQEKDLARNLLCKENNCSLFRVRYDYTDEDFNNLVINIQNIINNYGKT